MPSAPELIDPRSGMWAWMSYELRFQREKANLSLTQAGGLVSTSRKTVQNWEAGRHKPPLGALEIFDGAWNTGGLLARIHFYAQASYDPEEFGEYLRHEERATMIRDYETVWIPGLLQTEEYIRDQLVAGGDPEQEPRLEARLARQAILTKPRAPHASFLIDESALLRIRHETLVNQVARLLEASELPNVVIRLLPLSAGLHTGLNGPFVLVTTSQGEVVYEEASTKSRLVQDISDVHKCAVLFDRLGADALHREATRNYIRKMIEDK